MSSRAISVQTKILCPKVKNTNKVLSYQLRILGETLTLSRLPPWTTSSHPSWLSKLTLFIECFPQVHSPRQGLKRNHQPLPPSPFLSPFKQPTGSVSAYNWPTLKHRRVKSISQTKKKAQEKTNGPGQPSQWAQNSMADL